MKRYPLEPLAAAMGMSINSCCIALGRSGTTMQEYRVAGVSDTVAESMALKAGFHPFVIWPELADDRYEALHVACAECEERFVPSRKGHRFCSYRCGQRRWQREYQRRRRLTAEFNLAEAERQRALRASMSDRARRRELARVQAWVAVPANRERYNANRRAKRAS